MRQIIAITLNNLRALPSRWGISLVIVIGVAGVVAVLTSVMTMSFGLTDTATKTAREGWAMIIRKGAFAENVSSIPLASLVAIESAQGIERDSNGDRLLHKHYVAGVTFPRSNDPTVTSSVVIRGLEPGALDERFQLVEGRMFTAGKRELIVGAMAQREFLGLRLGDEISSKGAVWTVVGVFTYNGNAYESELFGDLTTVMAGEQSTAYSSVRVKLSDTVDIDTFDDALQADPRLKVEAKLESDYFENANTGALLDIIAYVVSTIMAIGATFGALNVMYTAVSTRTKEIATLRALGFGALPVAISVLVEAMVLALIGGVLGLVITALLFQGATFTTGTITAISTVMRVTPDLALIGLAWGAAIGFVGGLIPAVGAVRTSIVDGLRGN